MRRFCQFLTVCAAVLFGAPSAHARDLGDMSSDEIKALQQRLLDGHCYQGAIDGKASPPLEIAFRACPSQDPILRIETGMHVAPIKRIGVDKDCHIAVTGSDDKTARVWSLPQARLLHTLRMPIGPGNAGKVFAVAMSPDGRWIAAGGWDAQEQSNHQHFVYVFDTATGAMFARVGPFGNVINDLAFSSDGHWLAATSHADVGLKVIDAQTWRIAFEDKSYAGASYGAAFAVNGRLYTVDFDGKLRQYGPGPDFKKGAEIVTKASRQPFSVAVDPAGKLVAVGFNDSLAVEFYDASTLAFRFSADTKGFDNGDLSKVTWSGDGARLIAGGSFEILSADAWKRPLVTFDREGKRFGVALPLSDNTIFNLQPCGSAIAVAAADPAFGLVDGSGQINPWKTGVSPDLRGKLGDAFTIAANAKQVRYGLGDEAEDPVLFDLGEATVASAPKPVPGLHPPLIEGLPVTDWQNNYQPKLAGKVIPIERYEQSRSLAIRADRKGFVISSDFWVRAFDADGKLLWGQPGPAAAWGVNISDDGRIVIAAYRDGTIRWQRWSDGAELLALFVNRKTKTWVAWTPSGYYMASPGGEDLIGWHLNRGWSQAADFFPASKFRDKYSRADIVERVLDTLDEGEAIKQADLARPQQRAATAQAPIIENLPPVLSILSPADDAHVDTANLTVDYLIRSPSGTPIDSVEAVINGAPAGNRASGDDSAVKKCIKDTHGLGRITGALQGCRGSLTLALPPGVTEIGVFARTGGKSSDIAEVRVTRAGPPTLAETVTKPKLYALIAGISNYADPAYKLEFASKDAHDFAGSLANQNGALYAEVNIKLLADKDATAAAIKDGLDWLTHQVTEHDVGIVYLAGHGIVDERNRFYFLAADSDSQRLRATAVAKDDISDALDGLAGKALLFLDACHSGSMVSAGRRSTFDNNDVVNEFLHSERGVVVFAASTGRQVSVEDPAWGNGAFTKALVEGLGAPGVPALAKIAGDDTITPALLDAYIARRVKTLTGGKQSPVMNSTAPDFPLALVK
jgi:Caspase domain/WD domain, G-beta repeat